MKAKRSTVGLVAALLLALVGLGLLVTYMRGSDSEAEELGEVATAPVLVVTNTIPAGTTVTSLVDNADRYLQVREVPEDQVVAGTVAGVAELEALRGLLTTSEITPGEQLVRTRFVHPSEISRDLAAIEVPENLLQTTFAVEPQRALGGNIRAGATVAVLAAFDADGEEPSVTMVVLDKALVTNVQAETRFTEDQLSTDPLNPSLAPQGRLLITLGLGAKDTEKLAFALEYGRVWLAAQPETAEEGDGSPVTRDDVIGELARAADGDEG